MMASDDISFSDYVYVYSNILSTFGALESRFEVKAALAIQNRSTDCKYLT